MSNETGMTRQHRRTSALSVFLAVFLCLCFVLAAALPVVPAAAESDGATWEERLEAARVKYNKKTVNVYREGHGKKRNGKINVCFYPSENKPYINIEIRESLEITDEAEMQAILEVIAKNKDYSEETYGTIAFMKAQWIAHNLAHSMATGSGQQQALVTMIAGEDLASVITSAKHLDLSPYGNMSERQQLLYEIIEYVYGLDGH